VAEHPAPADARRSLARRLLVRPGDSPRDLEEREDHEHEADDAVRRAELRGEGHARDADSKGDDEKKGARRL